MCHSLAPSGQPGMMHKTSCTEDFACSRCAARCMKCARLLHSHFFHPKITSSTRMHTRADDAHGQIPVPGGELQHVHKVRAVPPGDQGSGGRNTVVTMVRIFMIWFCRMSSWVWCISRSCKACSLLLLRGGQQPAGPGPSGGRTAGRRGGRPPRLLRTAPQTGRPAAHNTPRTPTAPTDAEQLLVQVLGLVLHQVLLQGCQPLFVFLQGWACPPASRVNSSARGLGQGPGLRWSARPAKTPRPPPAAAALGQIESEKCFSPGAMGRGMA